MEFKRGDLAIKRKGRDVLLASAMSYAEVENGAVEWYERMVKSAQDASIILRPYWYSRSRFLSPYGRASTRSRVNCTRSLYDQAHPISINDTRQNRQENRDLLYFSMVVQGNFHGTMLDHSSPARIPRSQRAAPNDRRVPIAGTKHRIASAALCLLERSRWISDGQSEPYVVQPRCELSNDMGMGQRSERLISVG